MYAPITKWMPSFSAINPNRNPKINVRVKALPPVALKNFSKK